MSSQQHIVIIGGGFGGLACAIELGNVANVDVTLIDRRNHSLFQPLLYQVATAALSPADIAEPIRKTLARFKNIKMIMAEVTGVDAPGNRVLLEDGSAPAYDKLVIATGSDYDYFGHEEWRDYAPGLKSIHEARQIRHRLLLAFERAELAASASDKQKMLTSIIDGRRDGRGHLRTWPLHDQSGFSHAPTSTSPRHSSRGGAATSCCIS